MEKVFDEPLEDEVLKLKEELLNSKLEIVKLQQLVKKHQKEIDTLKCTAAMPACPEGKEFMCACNLNQEKVKLMEGKFKIMEQKVKLMEEKITSCNILTGTTAHEETSASKSRPEIISHGDPVEISCLQSQISTFQQDARARISGVLSNAKSRKKRGVLQFQTKVAAGEQLQKRLIATVDEKVQKLETKISDIQNEMVGIKNEMPQAQAPAYFVPQNREEKKVYELFLKHQAIVRNHLFPLSDEEHIKLGALETIICAKDRVAMKIERTYGDPARVPQSCQLMGKSEIETEAERFRRQGYTPVKAMNHYVKMTQGETGFSKGTKFFLVLKEGNYRLIVAVSNASLTTLDQKTKQQINHETMRVPVPVQTLHRDFQNAYEYGIETTSWQRDSIRECTLSDYNIWQLTVTFRNGKSLVLFTEDDEELQACILKMMRNF